MFVILVLAAFASATALPQTRTRITEATKINKTNETQETTKAYVYKHLRSAYCILPPNPPHGFYKLIDPPRAEPGQAYDSMVLEAYCDRGYGLVGGTIRVVCGWGSWGLDRQPYPRRECEKLCETPKNETVEYRCPVDPVPPRCFRFISGSRIDVVPCPIPEGADKGFRICKEFEKTGTVGKPVVKSSSEELPMMTCSSGSWEVKPSNMTESTTSADIIQP